MSVNVVILAAGQGKRMRSELPKVLHPLAGRALLSHVVDTARALTPARICIVYGHGGEQVPQRMQAPDLVFARQQPLLGTGHALQQALPHLAAADTTLVLYGDVPLTRQETLAQLLTGKGVRILTAVMDDPTGYGRIVRDKTGVRAIVEEKDAKPAQKKLREVNTGIMALPTAKLGKWLAKLDNRNAQQEYYLTDIVGLARADRVAVTGLKTDAVWETLGVNSKAQLAQLERLYQQQVAAKLLAEGVTLADPARIDVRGSLRCAADVAIDVGCVFEGDVEIGAGASVGPYCVLRNVRIGARTHLAAYTHADDATIGENCRIGPYARIRPGTRLADDVHIGNFVEVRASDIGHGSKANHLAYVGDSLVGRDVNIGAGTITCNYDGANKHRTVIEDDVHIGSDVQLVAPVTVGKGTTVAAGTTVWKDTPERGLVLNAKTQEHRPGWQRPRKKAKP